MSANGPLRIGVGGPVGSGKTTLVEKLCKAMRDRWSIAVVTNDIYTQEDALILNRLQALPEDRIIGVETGGCPHTAIREDASLNLAAIADMNRRHPGLDVIFIESGGDEPGGHLQPRPRRPDPLRGQRLPRAKRSLARAGRRSRGQTC